MGTTYLPFRIDLFRYFYELAIMQGLQNPAHNCTIHNIPVVFSLKNSKLYDYAHCIYLAEPEIKDTTDIAMSTSCIDLQNATDGKGWLRTKL